MSKLLQCVFVSGMCIFISKAFSEHTRFIYALMTWDSGNLYPAIRPRLRCCSSATGFHSVCQAWRWQVHWWTSTDLQHTHRQPSRSAAEHWKVDRTDFRPRGRSWPQSLEEKLWSKFFSYQMRGCKQGKVWRTVWWKKWNHTCRPVFCPQPKRWQAPETIERWCVASLYQNRPNHLVETEGTPFDSLGEDAGPWVADDTGACLSFEPACSLTAFNCNCGQTYWRHGSLSPHMVTLDLPQQFVVFITGPDAKSELWTPNVLRARHNLRTLQRIFLTSVASNKSYRRPLAFGWRHALSKRTTSGDWKIPLVTIFWNMHSFNLVVFALFRRVYI